MSSAQEFEALAALVQERLAAAVAASQTAAPPLDPTARVRGASDGGHVAVVLDGRGVLDSVQLDAISDLDADELRSATLDALAAAREALRAGRVPPSTGIDLHDTSLQDRLAALATGEKP